MQSLEVSGAVRLICRSLGIKGSKMKAVTFLITVPKLYAVYILRTLRNVSGTSCRENQSAYFITFRRKSCRLWDNVKKKIAEQDGRKCQYGAHALQAGYLKLKALRQNM